MDSKNFHLYNLRVGSRTSAVRTVKRLLHSRIDISYQDDGSSIYTPQLSSAVAQARRIAGLTTANDTLDEETWAAIGGNTPSYQLRQTVAGSGDDHYLLGLLNGSFAGGGLKLNANAVFVNGDGDGTESNDGVTYSITFDGTWAIANDFGTWNVSSEAKEIMDEATGKMATNIFRAMVTFKALNDHPKTKVNYKVEGTLDVASKYKKFAPTGGSVTIGAEAEMTSTDSILVKMTIANDNLMAFLIDALKPQTFTYVIVRNAPPITGNLGDLRTDDNRMSVASQFGQIVQDLSNQVAKEQYTEKYPRKTVPPVYWK